jgi:SAM-dependent methyltransferase
MAFINATSRAACSGALNAERSTTRHSTVVPSLADIVPTFDERSNAVRYNIGAWAALRRYAGARLAQTPIPSRVVDKHAKFVKALKTIMPSEGPTRDQLLSDYPEMGGFLVLLDECLENLSDILSGCVDPLAVMFPAGSFALVEPIYRDNPIADYFNRIVAEVVRNFSDRRGNRPIRVLEIGAGTGSTTQFVLPVLRGRDARYAFSDISLAFLNKAKGRFAEYPFIKYEIFNVEKPEKNDGLYDVVIAANAIHATADLPASLANVRSRVAPGGIFVLNELTSCHSFIALTFGLTEGWWLSVDGYRIENSPLLTGETWRSLLLDAGFVDTLHHGTSDQQVIVACVEPPPIAV